MRRRKPLCAKAIMYMAVSAGRIDAEKVQRTLGPHVSPLLFDVTDHVAIRDAAMKVEAEVGKEGLACLINNAGISTSGPLMLQPLDDIRHQFEVNVIGLFAVTQAFLPLLGARQNATDPPGRIINVSSVGGRLQRHLSVLMSE